MPAKKTSIVRDGDVYKLTRKGDEELRGSETSLSPAGLELLVRIDGVSTVAQIKAAVRSFAADAVDDALQMLIGRDYVVPAPASDAIDLFQPGATLAQPSATDVARAKAETAAGLSKLKESGYYVSIAHPPAEPRALGTDETLSVVVVEDDPILSRFLKKYLEIEGFDVRLAGNRDEIVAAFRRPPVPALALLDVVLPDIDGFEVLFKIRTHAALKSVPVIMLTARATRESVLKGLAGGANGYVTKPFEADALSRAVRTVLGLSSVKPSGANPWSKSRL